MHIAGRSVLSFSSHQQPSAHLNLILFSLILPFIVLQQLDNDDARKNYVFQKFYFCANFNKLLVHFLAFEKLHGN